MSTTSTSTSTADQKAPEPEPNLPFAPPWPPETGVWASYDMHCHCGAVRWRMAVSPPLLPEHAGGRPVYRAVECDCSICERNGEIAAHPKAANVHFTRGLEHRAQYLCGAGQNPHWFCRRCGSSIGTDLSPLMARFGAEARYNINVRSLP